MCDRIHIYDATAKTPRGSAGGVGEGASKFSKSPKHVRAGVAVATLRGRGRGWVAEANCCFLDAGFAGAAKLDFHASAGISSPGIDRGCWGVSALLAFT